MKLYFRILRYIKPYTGYAILNAGFNILFVVFSLFSLTMIAPFLDLLFLKSNDDYTARIAKGAPELKLNISSLIDNFYYSLTEMIVDPNRGKVYTLVFICMLVVIMFFLKNLCRYLALYFIAPIRNNVVRDIRNEIYAKIIELPLSYYSEERKGDIMSRMTSDVHEIEWSIMKSLEAVFRDPISIIIFMVTLVIMSPQLTLFVFILLPIAGVLIASLGKSLKRTSVKSKDTLGELISTIEETISGLRIIKAFNADKPSRARFASINQEYTKLMIRIYRKTDLSSPMSEFLGTCVMVVVMYFGGKLVLDDHPTLNASVFITYIAIFSQVIPPARSFTDAYYNIQKGIASAERIAKILDADITIQEAKDAKSIHSFSTSIEYKNVSFAYLRGDTGYALKNINLKIEKGKTIALVGQSGAGKSTLVDILPRFYDPSEGEVLIDGIPHTHYKITDLRGLMGNVTQESILFNDTVFNNIAFGIAHANEQDVIAAAKIANAHDFIMQIEGGYQSNIGDRGSKLSGGQRQRLSIARAVLKNPPILILDEATSALDTESERLVQDALSNLMKNRTSLIIAHRLSTILHADEIIVMSKGEIIERGTHLELLAKNGAYKKLSDMQAFV
ncbi:MAG TPA: ABC transporter transmembrane domain-containing protein [Bacteroidia bacterium]|nr:ABC transporter transmembrane domain-containing protein [Bacteroidia bacterium]HRH07487.1 ABC transporter transmembrane domain-containing protein [Bacteroidia bacterium]HRH62116.1 ABC transporter transmembrane domain-containing protein [Bacteroidia bacterium]